MTMVEKRMDWPLDQQRRGELVWEGVKAGGRPMVLRRQDWANAALYTMANACGLVWLIRLRESYPTDPLAALLDAPVGTIGVEPWLSQADDYGVQDVLYSAEAVCQWIYRTATKTSSPAMVAQLPQLPPGLGMAPMLGVLPIAAWYAITIVGVAATAAIAWYESEVSDDHARVAIAKAEYSAKVNTAIEAMKMQVATGQPVTVPGFISEMGQRQRWNASAPGRLVVGVGLLGVAGAAAYAAHKLGRTTSTSTIA